MAHSNTGVGGGVRVYTVAFQNPSHWHGDWDAARLMAAYATNGKHSAQKSSIRKPGLVLGRFVYTS